jgi:protein pelota
MKLEGRHIEKDRSGYMRITPQDAEDLWCLYNVVHPGDQLYASTVRFDKWFVIVVIRTERS